MWRRMLIPSTALLQLSRRTVLTTGATCAVWLPALAQEAVRTYQLGFLVQPQRRQFNALFDELQRHGFIEGSNLSVDSRGFGLAVEELEAAAFEVVQKKPDAIYSGGTAANRAVKRATTTIPIVVSSDDMIREHLVPSLARPGGNITGISILAPELDEKRLEFLINIAPGIRNIGALVDPGTTPPDHLQMLIAVARSRGVRLSIHPAAADREIEGAIEAARAAGTEALTVLTSALFHVNRAAIIERTRLARLPSMYQWPEYCAEGALITYGPSFTSMYRQAAGMLVKVMRGAKPADIPVEQPTKFELAINLKTAKELGLTIPSSLLGSADEVIE
jgi:putative ABC transport system substrate-binding protein